MEKYFQVFVSSTYIDLKDERQEVMKALLELDCIPLGMELFPASDEDAWTLIKRVIDGCDYYVVIVGGRYGSQDSDGISFTEREYDYALSKSKPCLAFLHASPEDIPAGKSELDAEARDKLEAFRKKVEMRKLCRKWTGASDLGGAVSRSVIKAIKDFPAEGWIRGRFAADQDDLRKIDHYRSRIEELESNLAGLSAAGLLGSQELAQGDDQIDVWIHYYDRSKHRNGVARRRPSINTIVALIGPYLIDECNEYEMEKILTEQLSSMLPDDEWDIDNWMPSSIDSHSYQTIKIQLIALGLIQKCTRKRAVSDTTTYWCLTTYGEQQVMLLRAITKPDDSEE